MVIAYLIVIIIIVYLLCFRETNSSASITLEGIELSGTGYSHNIVKTNLLEVNMETPIKKRLKEKAENKFKKIYKPTGCKCWGDCYTIDVIGDKTFIIFWFNDGCDSTHLFFEEL